MTIDELRNAPGVVSLTVGKPATMPGAELVKRKPKAPDVRTAGRGRWAVTLWLRCRVISSANRRDHWTVLRRRTEIQADAIRLAVNAARLHLWECPLPCVVTWTHVGRTMDTDNLAIAFKGLRDALARRMSVDDGDPRIRWVYEQKAGTPGVELKIESGGQP